MSPFDFLSLGSPVKPDATDTDCPSAWLFAVTEMDATISDGTLVFSGEVVSGTYQNLVMAYGDPAHFDTLRWTALDITRITRFNDIKDHWHVYALGYHWITYSVADKNELWLLKIKR